MLQVAKPCVELLEIRENPRLNLLATDDWQLVKGRTYIPFPSS